MNKFSLRDYLQRELGQHVSSFKATSYDQENEQYLCSDKTTENVYDFDQYIAVNHDKNSLPASPDAIYLGRKNLYFVEFKNQHPGDIDKDQIQRKFRNGTGILQAMLNKFTPKDCSYYFCVVFKDAGRPKYFDSRHIENSAVRFGLEALNKQFGNFYDKILTENIVFFIKNFNQLKC